MKTAQRLTALFLTLALFASTVAPAFATGFDTFQLTQDPFTASNVVSGGKYIAWLTDRTTGGKEVAFANVQDGTYGVVTSDSLDKKDLSIDPEGWMVWAEGSGTTTDINAYTMTGNTNIKITSGGANNRSPRVAGNYVTWLRTVSGSTHVMVANILSGIDQATDIGVGDNPRIVHANGGYAVFYEVASGNINYWENSSWSTHTAATPGFLCSDNTLGEATVRDGKVAYVKTCTLGDQTYYFSIGSAASALSDESDDSNTLVSSGLLTSANTPVVSTSSNRDTLVGWVEGSLLSTAQIQVKGVVGGLLGLLGLGSGSLLNDKPTAAGSNVVWQRHNSNGTLDILGRDHSGSGTDYTVATGATLEGVSSLAEVPNTAVSWGGFTKTTSGRKDVFVMVPKLTTPTGTNVRVTLGNGTSATFPTVTQAGDTTFTIKSLYSEPSVPLTGFQLGDVPIYYDVHTTAVWSGTATVCFEYKYNTYITDESLLQILHVENGSWVDRTVSIDTSNHVICAGVTSFSELAFALRAPTVISGIDVGSVSNVAPTNVTITGSGFLSGPKLYLGGNQLTNVVKVDDTTLTATIPTGVPAGTYDLILTNRYGSGATLAQAVKITSVGLSYLKDQLADAGLTPQSGPKVYALVQRAETEITAGNNKQAAETLRDFQRELRKVTGVKKQAFKFELIKKAYARGEFKVKQPITTDLEKIKGAKRVEPVLKNASLKLPKTTSTQRPVKKVKIATDEEKIQAIYVYTDGLITKLETSNENSLAMLQLGAVTAVALGGIIIVQHHVRRRRRANHEK